MLTRKQKYIRTIIFTAIFLGFFGSFAFSALAAANYQYELMEPIPGFEESSEFPEYITAIYKFGIWTIGIVAIFMIIWGGFTYITAAGNNSRMDTAKRIIYDALIGVLVAFAAWLILYVINPDLVKINISMEPVSLPGAPVPTKPGVTYPGVCQPVPSGPCSVSSLQSSCFSSVAVQASSICNGESNGIEIAPDPDRARATDKCQPGGEVVSWGLFQINLTVHGFPGLDCPSAFSGGPYTANDHTCAVIKQSLYNECIKAAKNPNNNITAACSIYNKAGGWSPWGANSKCKF